VKLPVKIVGAQPQEACWMHVDGAWSGPGLELSHWPGNRTPRGLGHPLSTGIALNFARLDPSDRARLAAGCTHIANNHFDTDGLCALFAVRFPERALTLERELLAAAACGDLFEVEQERGYQLDLVLSASADPDRSPIAGALAGLAERARHQRALEWVLEHLESLARADRIGHEDLWSAPLERWREDRRALALAARDDVVHLDWTTWTSAESGGAAPGRRALFSGTGCDRALWLAPRGAGVLARLCLSTRSWFDFQARTALPRPDLELLAARLNELEGCDPAGQVCWRAQASDSPAPELWFGRAEVERYAEHNVGLLPSRLGAAAVRRTIAAALRAPLEDRAREASTAAAPPTERV
jgi:hypothetical protein